MQEGSVLYYMVFIEAGTWVW